MKIKGFDRRTFIATFGIICLTILGVYSKLEVSGAIATCVLAIASANAAQAVFVPRKKDSDDAVS